MHDPLLPNLLERQSAEAIDQANEGRRNEERQSGIYHLYQDQDDGEEFVERRFITEIPVEHVGAKMMVKCLQLRLESEVEPVFASMAIYDAKEKKKLSENFHFDLNPEAIKKMLSSHVPYADMSTQSRTALFEISHPSQELYLVIRLEKVLQGDTAEPILKLVQEDKDKVSEMLLGVKIFMLLECLNSSCARRLVLMLPTTVNDWESTECPLLGPVFHFRASLTKNHLQLPLPRTRKIVRA